MHESARALMTSVLAALGGLAHAQPAVAERINTGGVAGAYHASFCPQLAAELKRAQLDYACQPSDGTVENLQRVAANPRQLGFGQLDVLALAAERADRSPVVHVRSDLGRECLFAVTRNKDLTNFGEIAVFAERLRFILPPAGSGSAESFSFLKSIDGDGLGRARQVRHAGSVEEAIREALSAEDTVTLFVQLPDPDNARFRLISDLDGHIVPVIDRTILRQQVGGQKVYFADETQVGQSGWLKQGQTVVTACTPVVLFTGDADRIGDGKARQDHVDMVATIRALPLEALTPKESLIERLLRTTREVTAQSAEHLMALSEAARARAAPVIEKAAPVIEKAREATAKAIEAAKPAIDKAAEIGAKAYERAKEEMKGLVEKAGRDAGKPAPGGSPGAGQAPAQPTKP